MTLIYFSMELQKRFKNRKTLIDFNSSAVNDILAITNYLRSVDFDKLSADELSNTGLKLSVLMVNLGQYVSEQVLRKDFKYIDRKFRYFTEYKNLREASYTVKDSDNMAQEEVKEKLIEELEAEYEANLIRTFYSEVERIVSNIQTRLKVLQAERAFTVNQ